MIICTLLKSTKNKVEGVWSPTYKLALLQQVETREIFSKDIVKDLLTNKNERAEDFGG